MPRSAQYKQAWGYTTVARVACRGSSSLAHPESTFFWVFFRLGCHRFFIVTMHTGDLTTYLGTYLGVYLGADLGYLVT